MENDVHQITRTSTNGKIQVFLTTNVSAVEKAGKSMGVVAAHELYSHVSLLIQTHLGKTTTPWYHGSKDAAKAKMLEERVIKVEEGVKGATK